MANIILLQLIHALLPWLLDLQRRFHTRELEEKVKLAIALVMRPGALQQLQQQQHDVDSKAKLQPLQAPAHPQQQQQLSSANEQLQLNESSTAAAADSEGATGKAALGVAFWVHPKVAITANHLLEDYQDGEEIIVAVHSSGRMQLQTLQRFSISKMYDYAVLIWPDGAVEHHMPLFRVQPPQTVSILSGTDNTLVGFQIGVQQDVSELLVEYGLKACNTQVGTVPVHISKIFSRQLIALYTSQTWPGCCGSVIASCGGSAIAIHVAAANSWLADHNTQNFKEVTDYLKMAKESLSEMQVAVLAEACQDVVAAAVDHVEKAAAQGRAAATTEAVATV